MTLIEVTNPTENQTINIIGLVITFLLGLFASLLIDKLRSYQKNKRNKKFIKLYLKNSILPNLPELDKGYKEIKSQIQNYESRIFKSPAFEDFNTKVLDGIKPVDYYEIFKEKYTLLNEIISMIEYLSHNLPVKINGEFYEFINNHLIEKNVEGDVEHVKNCNTCIGRQSLVKSILEMRIEEVKLLKTKIEELTM